MILYKYLKPVRLDVLKNKSIRFTQPSDLNDPFEFRPRIREVASDAEVQAHVEEHFEQLIDEELSKYGALTKLLPQAGFRELLLKQKAMVPELFRVLQPAAVQRLSTMIEGFFNLNIGILCLSEVRDSVLMWGHYTDNHQGFVIGFDSDHSFFCKRTNNNDEFGFLRRVQYQAQRPQVTLADTSSLEWFQTKSEDWSYEKEWRIVRVLSEADHRIAQSPLPVYLYDFGADAVREIIVGMRSTDSFIDETLSLAASFPGALVFRARENSGYGLTFDKIDRQRA